MSSYDEPTQQVRRPEPAPAPLPGSLDPLRGHEANGWPQEPDSERFSDDPGAPAGTEATGVLPLDEIFATVPAEAAPMPAGPEPPTATEEAPTWTAMPVVPVRSEPLPMAGRPLPVFHTDGRGRPDGGEVGTPVSARLRTDAASALAGTRRGVDAWLRRDDNGLMLLTALVAVLLILVIAAVG